MFPYKFDFRKGEQNFYMANGRRLYLWKCDYHSQFKYAVGINGTSEHYGFNDKEAAKQKVIELYNEYNNMKIF